LGYQGWLIATLNNEILPDDFGAMDGRVEDTHSYRCEVCGNIAAFAILNIIRCVYGFSPSTVEHVCDNQSTITPHKKSPPSAFLTRPNPMLMSSLSLELQS
jgi:hypothetical protein